MNITKPDFDRAAGQVPLTPVQTQEFWRLLQSAAVVPGTEGSARRFDVAHLAYYFGALIVMGAMGWYMTNAWESFGGLGMFGIAATYALVFATVGGVLWKKSAATGLRNLGGVLVTVAVGMTPLAIYGLERAAGWWPGVDPGAYSGFHEWIKGGWIGMEMGTVVAGLVALWFVRFPFLTAPVAFALWYMSMDLTPVVLGNGDSDFTWREYLHVSLAFGAVMLLAAYALDVYRRWQKPDYGFWLSFFGLVAFWGGLSLLQRGDEGAAFVYGLINVGLMLLGVVLDRRACVVFGALGVTGYLGHLAWDVFAHSPMFPFALSAFGILVIVCGVVYARYASALRSAMVDHLPVTFSRLVPALARGSLSAH